MRITLSSARVVRPVRPARSRPARPRGADGKTRRPAQRRPLNKNKTRNASMTSRFDFAPLFPAGLPAPSARWTGLAKYSFVGGNNDAEQVPLDELIEATNTVLR